MSSKPLLAVGGAAGVSLVAWRTMFPWIQYDWQTMKAGKKVANRFIDDINKKRTIIDIFEATVKKYPKKTFVILDDRCYSYEYVNDQACRVANIVIQWNLKKEDSVSIFVHNSIEYIWTFLGLKLGVITTLLNINTRGDPLVNAIQVTDTKAIIVGQGEDLYNAINEIRGKLDVPVYFMGNCSDDVQSYDMLMMKSSPADISPTVRSHINIFTSCCYIFTSGTTGLPKAALVSHGKALAYPKIVLAIDLKPEDVMYDVLPFYHATGLFGWLAASEIGCTVVIRKKFSAHQFWDDCRKYKVTLVQYIGELLRYLIALPEDPLDGNHNVKYFIGNGLRQDIWIPIQKRFKIPYIMEFFGASEATALMYNMCNKPGAVGRISPLMASTQPNVKGYLLKYDLATATPIRNESGRCIEVRIGEPGLLICGIPPTYKLENGLYKGSMEQTENKIVRNVFKEGDAYFNFGDSLYMDKDYFIYFHDRVGDTFRWKGENVSTTEVANIMTALSFIIDANVYGVKVPGHDGRAGMVSLVLKDNEKLTSEKLKAIYHHCEHKLPKYARPIVLRHEKEMRTTGTFKQHKVVLMEEGFDPKVVSDPMFYLSTEAKTYVPLNQTSHLNFLQSKL
ncbi:Hypothetical predicted protein [Mytilus galloprovincialis]|uniref:long-chain-fatty-acid--CoA ligase n=1 Tax=Mytilus galloprovincialis TaxID=29158 RepID=A0A8B6HG13_MYTGA|nr:Hypothetical predicted protein [Mytilus galloprovincialis]